MIFSIGQHIKSKDNRVHGIICKISENNYGIVYCIKIKGGYGMACVNESNCELY